MEPRKPYSTDLTDAEWAHLEPLIPAAKTTGRPARYPRREIVNAILYITRSGCAWRNLPHDLRPWSLAHYYFWHWRHAGIREVIHTPLRDQVRCQMGSEADPSAGVVDSQTAKTTEKGGSVATMEASE